MKPIQLHGPSLLVGATALGLVVLASSAFQTAQPADMRLRIVGPVQIEGIPTPRQMVRVVTGAPPLTVPAGKTFVATGIGFVDVTTTNGQLWVKFDGAQVLTVSDNSLHVNAGVGTIPPGLTAPAGTVVTVESSFSNREAVLLGYLVDV